MIVLFFLIMSLAGSVFFFFATEADLVWKILAVLMAVGAALMLFFSPIPPVVPIAMQVLLCLGIAVYWQIDDLPV